jgi:nucleoside-diphosphate-sugar epimerase
MNKILITGAGGYVGTALIKHILSNTDYKVRALDNFHKGNCDSLMHFISNPNFEFMYGDVTVPEHCEKAVDGVSSIIHLAAIVGFPACARQPALSNAVNVEGTRNILNARSYKQPLVFASTGSVYGKVSGICSEDSVKNPLTIYGKDKLEAESLVRKDGNSVALRFATGFGVSPCMRVNLLVNDLVYQAINNRSLNIFEGNARRTFIHVNDMATAFIGALEGLVNNTLNYDVYNAGFDSLNWTKRQLAEFISQRTGCFLTFQDTAKDLDQRDYEVDYSKFAKDIQNTHTTMEEGINELIKATPLLQIRHQYE